MRERMKVEQTNGPEKVNKNPTPASIVGEGAHHLVWLPQQPIEAPQPTLPTTLPCSSCS